jgi:orotate phosphoribosyltransferase
MITNYEQNLTVNKENVMTEPYETRVCNVVQVPILFSLKREEIDEILLVAKPIWFDGHFELLSEQHSDSFFRFALIAQYPYLMTKISNEMSGWIQNSPELGDIDVVLSTSRAGMLIAYDVAREINLKNNRKTRAAFVECDNSGYPINLQEDCSITKNERVLIVNDITTTGEALQKLIEIAEKNQGSIVGICVFATRQENSIKIEKIKSKYNFHSIINVRLESWHKNECPLCKKGEAIVYSKDINSLGLPPKTLVEVLAPLKRLQIG